MGEIFEREVPQTALPWTGERLTTAASGQVVVEHLHRYAFARSLCRGRDVLDLASGEGYGAALLAQVATSVVGVELDRAAVAHAAAAYARPNLRFVDGDARRIPLPAESVDVVVSFETLEHFYEHDAFIAEVRRVLRPGGQLVVSTPDRDAYSPAESTPNPFHVHELTRAEFAALLQGAFTHVTMFAQRPFIGAALVSETPGPLVTIERRGETRFEVSPGLARPLYWVGVASDEPVAAAGTALFIDTDDIEAVHGAARVAQAAAADLVAQLDALQPQAEAWRQQVLAGNAENAALQARLRRADEQSERARRDLIDRAAAQEALQERLASAEALSHDVEAARLGARSLLDGRAAAAEAAETEHRAALASERVAREAATAATAHVRAAAAEELATLHAVLSAHVEALGRAQEQLRSVFASPSWRLTGPLRGVASRNPRVSTWLGKVGARRPDLLDAMFGAAQTGWRVATLRSSRPDTPGVPRPEPALPGLVPTSAAALIAPPPPPPATGPGRSWFYVGDTLEWLQAGLGLTGVGRATSHLFFASLATEPAPPLPCAVPHGGQDLVGLPLHDTARFLRSRTGRPTGKDPLDARPPQPADAPAPGDHVLFTGAVWTPQHARLFERLAARGIRFGVLVYDIIPIEAPHFVSPAHAQMFAAWLRTTLALAETVFVSGIEVADRLLRWAALADVAVAADVVPVTFGSERPSASGRLPPGVRKPFILCVGTIDRRKNQVALCRAWAGLDAKARPQLVLAGRDDVGLRDACPEAGEAFDQGEVLVLEGLDDAAVATLYDACLFTVFPSLAEGYGLPVAESLACGKPCVASDLAVIREHAGDLPWYVPPGDEAALAQALRRALTPVELAAATTRLRERAEPAGWDRTWRQIESTPGAESGTRARLGVLPRPGVPGLHRPEVLPTLERAGRWCSTDAPDVSILIVNWRATALTLECIRQIWAATEGVRYEIVVADNGSVPDSLRPLRQLGRGVRLLELGINRYFGEATNIAAEAAQGRYLCLMNNDAFGRPGWLRALVDALDADPEAGAAGPRFLFPDGTVQEAGGHMDAGGYPVRNQRGAPPGTAPGPLCPVDYISAATLLVRKDCFVAAGGFDLAYEPAYYEDADLCLKLAALGRPVLFCPAATVIHVEGAAAGDPDQVRQRDALGDLNRSKFTARWDSWLHARTPETLRRAAAPALPPRRVRTHGASMRALPRAALFTPYALTPGGGERFLLATAAALAEDHVVTIVTPRPYSQLRLHNLGRDLGIDLAGCEIATESALRAGPAPDRLVVLGNEIAPPLPPLGRDNVYVCQFPFPLDDATRDAAMANANGYRAVVAYSEYARTHILAGLSAHRMPAWPIEVAYPPVPQFEGSALRKRPMVLTVGRFFDGGHSKRHDVLIGAFARLLARFDGRLPGIEMHLAGSATPDAGQMAFLDRLRRMADGMPVQFHVNVPRAGLAALYRDAALYWHGTGLDAPLQTEPGAAEHFGISVVEAMSAGCVPLALAAGGPREVVTDGVDGVLYASIDGLVDGSYRLLSPGGDQMRAAMGQAAARRAPTFAPDVFRSRIREIVLTGTRRRDLGVGRQALAPTVARF